MDKETAEYFLQMLQQIGRQVDLLEQQIKNELQKKQWLSTEEFAKKAGLTPQTVSTYCGQGKFESARKTSKGRWEIHKSELPTNQ